VYVGDDQRDIDLRARPACADRSASYRRTTTIRPWGGDVLAEPRASCWIRRCGPRCDERPRPAGLAKWQAQWPEWRVAEVFVPEAQRARAQAWFALRDELGDAAWGGDDPRRATPLGWWAEELDGWSRARHPLVSLQKVPAPWEASPPACRRCVASRERPADLESRCSPARRMQNPWPGGPTPVRQRLRACAQRGGIAVAENALRYPMGHPLGDLDLRGWLRGLLDNGCAATGPGPRSMRRGTTAHHCNRQAPVLPRLLATAAGCRGDRTGQGTSVSGMLMWICRAANDTIQHQPPRPFPMSPTCGRARAIRWTVGMDGIFRSRIHGGTGCTCQPRWTSRRLRDAAAHPYVPPAAVAVAGQRGGAPALRKLLGPPPPAGYQPGAPAPALDHLAGPRWPAPTRAGSGSVLLEAELRGHCNRWASRSNTEHLPGVRSVSRQVNAQRFAEDFAGCVRFDRWVRDWLASERGLAATPHAQRSRAEIRVELRPAFDELPLRSLVDTVEAALGTPVQTAVKREDEQAFAELNAANLMFCEDAARRVAAALAADARVSAWQVRVAHFESLHPHDAVARERAEHLSAMPASGGPLGARSATRNACVTRSRRRTRQQRRLLALKHQQRVDRHRTSSCPSAGAPRWRVRRAHAPITSPASPRRRPGRRSARGAGNCC
jgi:hypothetical protein